MASTSTSSDRISRGYLSARHPVTTSRLHRPFFLSSAISRIVSIDSRFELSMKLQVLTMMTSASDLSVVTVWPAFCRRPSITSLSTRFFGHPRLINPILLTIDSQNPSILGCDTVSFKQILVVFGVSFGVQALACPQSHYEPDELREVKLEKNSSALLTTETRVVRKNRSAGVSPASEPRQLLLGQHDLCRLEAGDTFFLTATEGTEISRRHQSSPCISVYSVSPW